MRSRLKRKALELEAACVMALKKPTCEATRGNLQRALQWDETISYMRMRPAIRGKVNQVRAYTAQLQRRLGQNADRFLIYDGIESLRSAVADLSKLLLDDPP